MNAYLSEPPISSCVSPLQFWKSNMSCFLALAQAARKYLSAPCTNVDSERLFSAASNVIDEKRNRLMCEKAEMLLFIKKTPHSYIHRWSSQTIPQNISSWPFCEIHTKSCCIRINILFIYCIFLLFDWYSDYVSNVVQWLDFFIYTLYLLRK